MQYSNELNPRSLSDEERYRAIIVLEKKRMSLTRKIEKEITEFGKKSKKLVGREKGRRVGREPNDFNEREFKKRLKSLGIKLRSKKSKNF